MHLFCEKKLSIFSFPRSLTKSVRWLFHERALSAKPRMLDSCSTRVTARQNKKVKHAAKLLHRNISLWYWILYSHLINLLHDVTSVLIVEIWNLAQQIPLRFNKQLNKYIPILRSKQQEVSAQHQGMTNFAYFQASGKQTANMMFLFTPYSKYSICEKNLKSHYAWKN